MRSRLRGERGEDPPGSRRALELVRLRRHQREPHLQAVSVRTSMKVFIGSDHAGLPLKAVLVPQLKEAFPELDLQDLGTHDSSSCDYPDFAKKVAEAVASNRARGILVCGSG